MASTERGTGFRTVLLVRDLRLLLLAFTVDAVGGWAYNVVLVVYAYDRTGSTAWVAATTASSWVPRFLAAAYAGVLADRFERRRVMTASALVSFAVMAALTVAVASDGSLVLILGLSVVAAITTTPYRPAASGLLPDLVPERQLTAANALLGLLESLVIVVGPALGGLLLALGQPAVGVGINAVSFLLAAAVVQGVRTSSRAEQPEQPVGVAGQIAEGLRELRSQRLALVLVVYCALDSAVYGASTVLYVPIGRHVGLGSNGYSYLLAAMAVGGVLLSGLVNRLSASSRLTVAIVGGMWALALPTALTALTSDPAVALGLQVVGGAGMIMVDVLAVTALQRDLPGQVLGRVFGLLDAATIGAMVVASVVTSVLLRVLSLSATLAVVGLGVAAITLIGIPALLSADRKAEQEVRALAPLIDDLEALDLFSGASRTVLESLARALEPQEFATGTALIRQGEAADALWLLRSGSVLVTAVTPEGAQTLLGTQGAGTYVGEIGVMHRLSRSASVVAAAPTTAWRLAADDFRAALDCTVASPALLSISGWRMARTRVAPAEEVAPV